MIGKHLGHDLTNPEPARDRLRSRKAVACQHHHTDNFMPKCLQGANRILLDWVDDRDHPGSSAIDRDQDYRLALHGGAFQRVAQDPPGLTLSSASRAPLPTATCLPSTTPVKPLPAAREIRDVGARDNLRSWRLRRSRLRAGARCRLRGGSQNSITLPRRCQRRGITPLVGELLQLPVLGRSRAIELDHCP